MNFWSATWALSQREVIRFLRQRSRWVGALATPLLFWLLIGGGLGKSFSDPTGLSENGYLGYFFPGTLTLTVLFTAIFSTISVIEDRHQGFLQSVLVAPVPRAAFVLAKIFGGSFLGLLQGALLLCFAPLAGVHLNVSAVLESFLVLFVMSMALTALGFLFAWIIDSVQGYHGIMNMILMPMWILSGAVFPAGDNLFFSVVEKINPLTYGVRALRVIFAQANGNVYAGADSDGVFTSLSLALGVLFVFFAGLFTASVVVVNRAPKKA